jgi:glycine/D-amino acid oxidase-like deaminating enzyme
VTEVDFIIVGQGLAGTVLGITLEQNDCSVFFIDKKKENSASRVAAGIYNPLVFKRLTLSWMAKQLIAFAESFYQEAEIILKEDFLHPLSILKLIDSDEELQMWNRKKNDEDLIDFIKPFSSLFFQNKNVHCKEIFSSGFLDVKKFIDRYRNRLTQNSKIADEDFQYNELQIENDFVFYKNIKTKKIIFCEGINAIQNPFFKEIKFLPAKGEILTIVCEGLPEDHILMKGKFLIPVAENIFKAGSNYEWNFENDLPSGKIKTEIENDVQKMIDRDFKTINHEAAIRPTMKDRRPVLGIHPHYKQIGIFNGLGTKGVMLAPYFAQQFFDLLSQKIKLLPNEIDINRFYH